MQDKLVDLRPPCRWQHASPDCHLCIWQRSCPVMVAAYTVPKKQSLRKVAAFQKLLGR